MRHRTLYVRKHNKDTDGLCAACDDQENIEHLIDCAIIRLEFWDKILALLEHFDFPQLSDRLLDYISNFVMGYQNSTYFFRSSVLYIFR